MKAKAQTQQAILRQAREALGYTNAELAAALGKSLAAIASWLVPSDNVMSRTMPKGSRLLLDRIVAEHLAAKRRGAR